MQKGALGHGGLDAGGHRQRLVVDEHPLGGVLGEVAVARHDDAYGLADVAGDVDCGGVMDDAGSKRRAEGARVRRDLGAGHDADHAGQRARRCGIDRADARVRERRSHDGCARDVGQRVEVVDEPALPSQEGIVPMRSAGLPTSGRLAGMCPPYVRGR
jgi:hypothetical protein